MKITKFEWKQNKGRIQSAKITIKHGWWLFAYTEDVEVIRIIKAFSDKFGNWIRCDNGEDIDIPREFYECTD